MHLNFSLLRKNKLEIEFSKLIFYFAKKIIDQTIALLKPCADNFAMIIFTKQESGKFVCLLWFGNTLCRLLQFLQPVFVHQDLY